MFGDCENIMKCWLQGVSWHLLGMWDTGPRGVIGGQILYNVQWDNTWDNTSVTLSVVYRYSTSMTLIELYTDTMSQILLVSIYYSDILPVILQEFMSLAKQGFSTV